MTSDEWDKLGKKLGQLRALARSASGDGATGSLDEARNAALAFCGLLDRYKLQIAPKDAIIDPSLEVSSGAAGDCVGTAEASAAANAAANVAERMARAKARAGGSMYGTPKTTTARVNDVGADDFPDKAKIAAERIRRGVVILESKYRGECLHCEKPYVRGEKIYWKRDKGAWHPQCWMESIFAKAPPPPPAPVTIEDDDFDGLHSIWGGSPMRGGRRP